MPLLAFLFSTGAEKIDSDYMDISAPLPGLKILA